MRVIIHFSSPLMANDRLELEVATLEEATERYINWWKGYKKDEEYALEQVIHTEVLDD